MLAHKKAVQRMGKKSKVCGGAAWQHSTAQHSTALSHPQL